jgi:hypothetical protein
MLAAVADRMVEAGASRHERAGAWRERSIKAMETALEELEHFSIRSGVSRVREISVAFFFGNTFEK